MGKIFQHFGLNFHINISIIFTDQTWYILKPYSIWYSIENGDLRFWIFFDSFHEGERKQKKK